MKLLRFYPSPRTKTTEEEGEVRWEEGVDLQEWKGTGRVTEIITYTCENVTRPVIVHNEHNNKNI